MIQNIICILLLSTNSWQCMIQRFLSLISIHSDWFMASPLMTQQPPSILSWHSRHQHVLWAIYSNRWPLMQFTAAVLDEHVRSKSRLILCDDQEWSKIKTSKECFCSRTGSTNRYNNGKATMKFSQSIIHLNSSAPRQTSQNTVPIRSIRQKQRRESISYTLKNTKKRAKSVAFCPNITI